MEGAVLPDVRAVDPERTEPLRRQLEVERLREREERHGETLAAGRAATTRAESRAVGFVLPTSWPRPAAAWSRPESLVDELVVPVDGRARSVEPALHLLDQRLEPLVDLLQERDLLVGVLAVRVGARRGARLELLDPRLHVRVELLEPRLDLLGERDALLRSAACAAAAVPREAQLDAVNPVAQVLEPLPGAALALRRRRRRRRRAGAGRGLLPSSPNATGTAASARTTTASGTIFLTIGSLLGGGRDARTLGSVP